MSTTSEKALATFVAIVAFGIMTLILTESELIGRVWHYWQTNAVIPAGQGRWELPALVVSLFAIPAAGLMIPLAVAMSAFELTLKAAKIQS